jgi:hypothetical protein
MYKCENFLYVSTEALQQNNNWWSTDVLRTCRQDFILEFMYRPNFSGVTLALHNIY